MSVLTLIDGMPPIPYAKCAANIRKWEYHHSRLMGTYIGLQNVGVTFQEFWPDQGGGPPAINDYMLPLVDGFTPFHVELVPDAPNDNFIVLTEVAEHFRLRGRDQKPNPMDYWREVVKLSMWGSDDPPDYSQKEEDNFENIVQWVCVGVHQIMIAKEVCRIACVYGSKRGVEPAWFYLRQEKLNEPG